MVYKNPCRSDAPGVFLQKDRNHPQKNMYHTANV